MIRSLDVPLLKLLGEDASQGSDVLAKKLNVSAATIRRRINQLRKEELLRIVGIADPNKIGLPLAALIALNVPSEKLDEITDELAKNQRVNWVSTTTGRFNIMALVRASSTDDLASFIQRELPLDGVTSCETLVCLRVKKGQYIQV